MSMFIMAMTFASCNKEDSSINATPTISIADGQILQFGQENVINNKAQQVSITFSTNMDWTIKAFETNGGWCTPSVTSGKAGTSTVAFNVSANNESEDRISSFYVSCGSLTKTITIVQKAGNALTLSTDKFEVPLEGGTIDVQVLSNIEYTIVLPDEYKTWIHQTSSRASAVTTHNYFTVDASEEYDKREALLYVKSTKGEEVVHIYQVGSSILVLSANTINIGAEGGNAKIVVSSNFDYSVEMPNVTWISNGGSRSVTTSNLNFTIDPNTGFEPRSANVVVYDRNSSKKEIVTIVQEGKTYEDHTPSYVEAVDLGLPSGLLWASVNVGATKPSEKGTYVSWGETEGATFAGNHWDGKLDFRQEDYKFYKYEEETIDAGGFTEVKTYKGYTKYTERYYDGSSNGFKDYVDNKETLDPEDDLATTKWGGKWRTPSVEDIQELKDYCTWTYGKIDEVEGYKVTGNNGKWIFIPISGYCSGAQTIYFTLTLSYYQPWINDVMYRDLFWSNKVGRCLKGVYSFEIGYADRYEGRTIRPVRKK